MTREDHQAEAKLFMIWTTSEMHFGRANIIRQPNVSYRDKFTLSGPGGKAGS